MGATHSSLAGAGRTNGWLSSSLFYHQNDEDEQEACMKELEAYLRLCSSSRRRSRRPIPPADEQPTTAFVCNNATKEEEEAAEEEETLGASSPFDLLSDEIIFHIFSFLLPRYKQRREEASAEAELRLRARALLFLGSIDRRLRGISGDGYLWEPIYRAFFGRCARREDVELRRRGGKTWRELFVDRYRDCLLGRRRRRGTFLVGEKAEEERGAGSSEAKRWSWYNLSTSLRAKKYKLVFVGLSAAGKTSCCYRLQNSDPEPFSLSMIQGIRMGFRTKEVKMDCWDLGGAHSSLFALNHEKRRRPISALSSSSSPSSRCSDTSKIPTGETSDTDSGSDIEAEEEERNLASKRSDNSQLDQQEDRVFAPLLAECDALVFVVDAHDRSKLRESRKELHRILHHKALPFNRDHNNKQKKKPTGRGIFPVLLLANKQDLPGALPASQVERIFQRCFKHHDMISWKCVGTCCAPLQQPSFFFSASSSSSAAIELEEESGEAKAKKEERRRRDEENLFEAVWWLLNEVESCRDSPSA
ncbi:hypothetical protein QOT17_005799 [Balamuthia mandrillaris]